MERSKHSGKVVRGVAAANTNQRGNRRRLEAGVPELPDVEGFKHVLEGNALGKTIAAVVVHDARILDDLSAEKLASALKGARLVSAIRHGKHLLAHIGGDGWLVLHFGMSGALEFIRKPGEEPPFTRVHLDFASDGSLAYTNRRMIGHVGLAKDAADFIAAEKLGPDALDPHFDLAAFKKAIAGTRRNVKSVLMDQEIVAGVGNIYSDEILFQARISPLARTDELSSAEIEHLFIEMRKVLKTAVAHGAGSEKFVERMPQGALLPERRKGGHCPRCQSPLKSLKLGGRTAYCCPHCQKC